MVVHRANWRLPAAKAEPGQSTVTVISAASYVAPVAPDPIAAAFGTRLATQTVIAPTDADPGLPGIQLPTELGGTTMEINGRRAGLFFVSPNQINFLVPVGTAAGMATISVRSGDGTVSAGTVRIEPVAPGIFTANASGRGAPAGLLLRVLPNGQQIYEDITQFNPATNMLEPVAITPKTAGERLFLILFLTGVRGAADPNQDGNVNETVHLLLGGEEIIPAYVGAQGVFLGLDQMNVEISPSLFGRDVVDAVVNYSTLAFSNAVQIRLGGTPPPDLTVSGLSQEPLLVGEEFVINGAGFSTDANDIQVEVVGDSGEPYRVTQFTGVTLTQIKGILPFNAASGYVRVKVRQREVASSARLKVRTSISGKVVDNTKDSPIPGVTVRVNGLSTMSDREGRYVLPDVPPSVAQQVVFESSSLPLPYPVVSTKKRVEAGRDNHIEKTALTQQSNISLPFSGSAGFLADEELQAAAQPNPRAIQTEGITFEVPGNTTAIFPGGGNSGAVFLTKVDNSRPPVRLPAGVFSSSIAQLSPFNVRLTPGGKLTFPNADSLPANAQPKLYRLDQTPSSPTLGEFVEIGTATVSADGKIVETAANAVLETSIFFAAIPRPLTRVLGKVVDSDGTTPVRQAAVRCRGQEVFTDATGLFVLLDVPVRDVSDLLTLEASYQRPNGRVDRVTRTGVVPIPNGVTRVTPDLKLPSAATDPNRPPTLLLPASLTVAEGATLDTGFIASDPDAGQAITVTVSSLPTAPFASIGLSGSAYTLRLAPGAGTAGNYTLTATATDNGTPTNLTAMQNVAVTVNKPPALAWIQLAPTGLPPSPRYGVTTVYDPSSNRMIVFGGRDSSAPTNDVWALTNANGATGTGQWINVVPNGATGAPPVRYFHSAVYDSANNRMIVFGGCNGGCLPTLNDVWVLTNANGLGGAASWIRLSPTGGTPSARTGHTAVYDQTNNRMILYAGQNGSGNGCATFADVWVLSNANGLGGTPAWVQLSPTGGPPSGQYASRGGYDPASNRLIVFGGGGIVNGSCNDSNALWALSNANGIGGTPTWIQMIPERAAGSPAGRAFHPIVYDAPSNQMIMFGDASEGGGTPTNKTWLLANASGLSGTPSWTELPVTGTLPEARNGHGAILDPATGRMTMFGGARNQFIFNDTWVLSELSR